MISVVGFGPGHCNNLTEIAINTINKAEILIGGKRHLDGILKNHSFIENNQELFEINNNFSLLESYIDENLEKNIVLIASGDPSLYGIGDYIIRKFNNKTNVVIIPGISSIQYAFSKFKINMNDLFITSSHGRNPDFDFLFSHKKIAIVTDEKIGPYEIASEINKRNLSYNMYIGENLSYENEKLTKIEAKNLKREKFSMAVVILEKIE